MMNEVRRNNHNVMQLGFLTGASIVVLSHDGTRRRKSLRIATVTMTTFYLWFGIPFCVFCLRRV